MLLSICLPDFSSCLYYFTLPYPYFTSYLFVTCYLSIHLIVILGFLRILQDGSITAVSICTSKWLLYSVVINGDGAPRAQQKILYANNKSAALKFITTFNRQFTFETNVFKNQYKVLSKAPILPPWIYKYVIGGKLAHKLRDKWVYVQVHLNAECKGSVSVFVCQCKDNSCVYLKLREPGWIIHRLQRWNIGLIDSMQIYCDSDHFTPFHIVQLGKWKYNSIKYNTASK